MFLRHAAQVYGALVPSVAECSPSLFAGREEFLHPRLPRKLGLPSDGLDTLRAAFTKFGRCGHFVQVLASHPTYADPYLRHLELLMYDEGPLPRATRAYIARMAAAQMQARGIMYRQRLLFLADEGNSDWLSSLQCAPLKIQRLAAVHAALAHKPWEVDSLYFTELLTGEDAWTKTELLHALLIMVTYHATSCMTWGMGIQPEWDAMTREQYKAACAARPRTVTAESVDSTAGPIAAPQTQSLLRTLQKLEAGGSEGKQPAGGQSSKRVESAGRSASKSSAQASSAGARSETQPAGVTLVSPAVPPQPVVQPSSAEPAAPPAAPVVASQVRSAGVHPVAMDAEIAPQPGAQGLVPTAEGSSTLAGADARADKPDTKRYIPELRADAIPADCVAVHGHAAVYDDFQSKSGRTRLHPSEWSWDTPTKGLLAKFAPEAARLLDELFYKAYTLTYNTFGDLPQKQSTTAFRRAIWLYVQKLYGIEADDYDYSSVNVVLEIRTKVYVKKVVTCPFSITQADYEDCRGSLRHDEMTHINLLCIEAKRQAALMYLMKALP